MNRYDTFDSAFDCTPRQYHARVDKLWEALGLTEVQDEDVFTLAARAIGRSVNDTAELRSPRGKTGLTTPTSSKPESTIKLNAWIEALSPDDKARLAAALNEDPVTALSTYKALAEAEALEVLRELFDIHPLVDLIYDVRDREGKGWGGPLVTRWSAAVARAEALIKEKL